MDDWLYRFEIKGIQAYIVATGRMLEITGGSALIERLGTLVEQAAGQLCGDRAQVLSRAAGAASLRFHDRGALEVFVRWWPLLAERRAPGLRVIQGWVADSSSDNAFARLAEQLRVARSRHTPTLPEAGPLMARAARTGLPAVARDEIKGGLLDAATATRLREGRRAHDRLGERLLGGEGPGFVRDLDDLGSSYLAVVHVDGNDIGRRVMGLKGGADGYQRFSDALTACTLAASRAAVRTIPPGGRGAEKDTVPARPVVMGGDDFTIITCPEHAGELVKVWLTAFERETSRKAMDLQAPGGLTACAGIAFVKRGSPFWAAHELAEDLCGFAKRSLRQVAGRAGATPSGLAFHRVTDSALACWDHVAEHSLAAWDSNAVPPRSLPLAFTAGPYCLADASGASTIGGLEELAKALGGVGRGVMREWLTLARADDTRARAHWDRAQQVTGGSHIGGAAWRELHAALTALGTYDEQGWLRIAGQRRTPLLDAMVWKAMRDMGRGSDKAGERS